MEEFCISEVGLKHFSCRNKIWYY